MDKKARMERFVDKDGKYAFKWIYEEEPKQIIPLKVEEIKAIPVEEPKKKRLWKK